MRAPFPFQTLFPTEHLVPIAPAYQFWSGREHMLRAPTIAEVMADRIGQLAVLEEMELGLRLVSGWPVVRGADPGWIGLMTPGPRCASWLAAEITAANVAARADGACLSVPAGPAFLDADVAYVIGAVGRAIALWAEHAIAA